MEILDFYSLIVKNVPNLLSLIDVAPYENKVKEKLQTRNDKRYLRIQSRDADYDLYRDGDFYDLLYLSTKIGDDRINQKLVARATVLLNGFNELFKSLCEQLDNKIELIKPTVEKILLNINNAYLHYIGELLVLDVVLKSGHILNDVASKLENGKDLEYSVTENKSSKTLLIEVINIHSPDINPKKIKRKLIRKINTKSKNIGKKTFYLQPVIWTRSLTNLKTLTQNIANWKDYIMNDNILEPFAFVLRRDGDKFYFQFTSINEIFK